VLPSCANAADYKMDRMSLRSTDCVHLPRLVPPCEELCVMRTIRRMRDHLYATALLITLALTLIISTNASAVNDPPGTRMPDVLVWVDARNPGGHWVSLTYPKVVPKSQAEDHLGRLLQETGWAASNITISDGSVMKSGDNPMTSAEFVTPSVLQPDAGHLPIEPIIKALKDLKNIEIQYLVSPTFQFTGLSDYENRYVKIGLERGNNTYRYIVLVKSSNFESLDLPASDAPEQPAGDSGRSSRQAVRVLVIMLALVTAALAFVITAKFTRKGGRGTGRRS